MARPKSDYRAARRNAARGTRSKQLKAERKRTGESRSEQDARRRREKQEG